MSPWESKSKKAFEGENSNEESCERSHKEVKKEIIVKHEYGVSVSNLASQYSVTKSSIFATVKKKK